MKRIQTELYDKVKDEFVEAILHVNVNADLIVATEASWSPARKTGIERLRSVGVAPPEHFHWDWSRKIPKLRLLACTAIAIECNGTTQGLMMLKTAEHVAWLPPDKGRDLVYVEYLENAPWNIKGMTDRPQFAPIGIRLIEAAVRISQDEGFFGRVGLHSLQQAESFYEQKCGMKRTGDAPDVEGLAYFEFTAEAAELFLERGGIEMEMNKDRNWLQKMVALEDGDFTSVGGLVSQLDKNEQSVDEIDWQRFPWKEMARRGWIEKSSEEESLQAVRSFVGSTLSLSVMCRRTTRRTGEFDEFALAAWKAQVARKASGVACGVYAEGQLNLDLMKELTRLSTLNDGPNRARAVLSDIGIALVVEPHLPKTYLDGAAFQVDGQPIVGLTIRFDRIDNFWFCLMHELAHVMLHLKKDDDEFFDDIESTTTDSREIEADRVAGEVLIPAEAWDSSAAKRLPSPQAALQLARKLGIHEAIVAGRIRQETKNFKKLAAVVGQNEVRKCFGEIEWR